METFFMLLALCAGNSMVTSQFPTQRPVMQSFDVFFDLRLNKCLSKQSRDWWFEMPSRSLWRHCNITLAYISSLVLVDLFDTIFMRVSKIIPQLFLCDTQNIIIWQRFRILLSIISRPMPLAIALSSQSNHIRVISSTSQGYSFSVTSWLKQAFHLLNVTSYHITAQISHK